MDFPPPQTQFAGRFARATHITVSRGKFARATTAQGRNVRLEIWLAGWQIDVYDEFAEQPQLG
jgi:transcription antitermination factor NusA-like protein